MKKITVLIIILSSFNPLYSAVAADAAEMRKIFFPTDRRAVVIDNFGDKRVGRSHEGVDIMGEQMMPLYAAVDGHVSYLVDPEASWGYAVTLKDSDGYTYHYLHINNDTPGTDDGQGGTKHAYAPDIKRGAQVVKGQLIGWMGDSGNAEAAGHHLHFEIRRPDKTPIDGYASLIAALNPEPDYDAENAKTTSPDINTDKGLAAGDNSICESGSLIKLAGSQSVYYCGADGKRYVFPNEKIYFSWYDDFETVEVLTDKGMADITLGGNVTYRPGARMIKIQTSPKVYAVDKNGRLRWVQSVEVAGLLYGEDWNKMIDDLPDAFYFDYTVGEPITQ